MVAFLSLVSLAGGAATSRYADRLPMQKETAELCGGLLIVLGCILAGVGLAHAYC